MTVVADQVKEVVAASPVEIQAHVKLLLLLIGLASCTTWKHLRLELLSHLLLLEQYYDTLSYEYKPRISSL